MNDLAQNMLTAATALREASPPQNFAQAIALEMSVATDHREAIVAEAGGDVPGWLRTHGFHLAAAQIDADGWPA